MLIQCRVHLKTKSLSSCLLHNYASGLWSASTAAVAINYRSTASCGATNSGPDTASSAQLIPEHWSTKDVPDALNPEAKDDMTEEEWRQAWQQFWWGANDAPASGK